MVTRSLLAAIAVVVVVATSAPAQPEAVQARERRPGGAALAALANTFFAPVRLAIFVVTGEMAGLTGWLTAGNQQAADDVASILDGPAYVQPEHLYREEPPLYEE